MSKSAAYVPPADDRMAYPGHTMFHVPAKDAFQRRYFMRMLEVDFRNYECAANKLRRPENRVVPMPVAPTVTAR